MSSTTNNGLSSDDPPSMILIVGAGVFGLSTALALCQREQFNDTSIVIIDRCPFPAPDGASIDTSRIIRADYADPSYSALAALAQDQWRGEYGAQNRYLEVGLCLTAEKGREHYVAESLKNVQMLENLKREQNLNEGAKITVCESNVELAASTGTGGASGTHGYINHNSGWADAESTMRYLRKKVQDLRRCAFLTVPVERLLFSDDQSRCTGVQMEDGNFLTADLIIVAAGAWSPTLVDLRGRVMATGQVLTYIPVTPSEAEILSKTPVQLNMSSGLFIIPPPSQSALPSPPSAHCKGQLYLKIARHGYGYTNPKMIPHPEDPSLKSIEVSIPHTNPNTPKAKQKIPEEGQQALRSFLHLVIPPSSPLAAIADRPSEFSRICHYADTPDGHFLISYHPAYNKSLFIATGGSGHGFKFLPVIGEKIVDCLVGKCPVDFADKWSWGEPVEGPWESDGSRGGEKGMVLVDEMKKGGMKI